MRDNSPGNSSPEFKPSGYGAFPTKPKTTAKPKVSPAGNGSKKPTSSSNKPVKQSGGPPAGVGIVLLVLISLAGYGAYVATTSPSKAAAKPVTTAEKPVTPTPVPTPKPTPSPAPTPPSRFNPDNERGVRGVVVEATPRPRRTPRPQADRPNRSGRTTRNETPEPVRTPRPRPSIAPRPVVATPRPTPRRVTPPDSTGGRTETNDAARRRLTEE